MNDRVAIASVRRVGDGPSHSHHDLVAVEAPLGVELIQPAHGRTRALGILMRTPGDDDDLVVGWLYTEGIIRASADVIALRPRPGGDAREAADVLEVELAADVDLDRLTTDRATLATSACGLCGRLLVQGADALGARAIAPTGARLAAATIASLPAALRGGQAVFAETGGLHGAALVDMSGRLVAAREDVGRHNAVDKLVGAALRAGQLPAADAVLVVSGRVAFEIVQKAVVAGIAAIVAVGAPSSLAVSAARAANLTLVGFARDGRFNIYCGADRVSE